MTCNLALETEGRVTYRDEELLNDEVKVSCPRLYPASKRITGLEAAGG